jgi:hypothetical protein
VLSKKLDEVEMADIQSLIDNSVPESKTLEYKQSLNAAKDSDKKEFLGDVSSFFNAEGGDIIYGLAENNGIANKLVGVETDDLNSLQLRIESLVRDGIEPRMPIKIKTLSLEKNKIIVILRMEKSWNAPHRVVFQGHDKFYSRNSAGKYSLDTSELRNAFNMSNSLIDKINSFRDKRIMDIMNGNAPTPVSKEGKVILHFIPLNTFYSGSNINLQNIMQNFKQLGLICDIGFNHKYNLNGYLLYDIYTDFSYDYAQLFRNGSIEAAESLFLSGHNHNPAKTKKIYINNLERYILEYFIKIIGYFQAIDICPPIYFAISMLDVKDYSLDVDSLYNRVWKISDTIEDNIIKLPEAIISDFSVKPEVILRPMFNIIWNTCSFEKSNNFDKQGNYIIRN